MIDSFGIALLSQPPYTATIATIATIAVNCSQLHGKGTADESNIGRACASKGETIDEKASGGRCRVESRDAACWSGGTQNVHQWFMEHNGALCNTQLGYWCFDGVLSPSYTLTDSFLARACLLPALPHHQQE